MEIFNSIKILLTQLIEQIDKYTLTFKQKDFFTFSDIEERSKAYRHQYSEFIGEFNRLYASLEQHILKIVALLLEAERSGDEEKIILFKAIFEKHLLLEKALLSFTSASEKELSGDCASVSSLLESASRLSITVKALSDTVPH